MKKMICALAAAGMILGGGSAWADDLHLPDGTVLPLGKDVTVWQGKDSYFAPKVNEWLKDPKFEKAVTEGVMKSGAFTEAERPQADFLAKEIIKYLQASQVYQLRSVSGTTMYTAYVFSVPVSLPLSADELNEWNEVVKTVGDKIKADPQFVEKKLAGHGELSQSVELAKNLAKAVAQDKGVTKSGISYDTAEAFVDPEAQGIVIPLYVYSVGLTKDKSMSVTVVVTDQASGQYFQPYLKKGVEGAK